MCDWCYVALLCHPTFNSSTSGSSPSATYCEIYNGFLGLGALCLIWTFLPSKKNLRRVLIFEVIGIPGQWVNDDTIFLVSRSDTISSKSGIDGKINLYCTLWLPPHHIHISHTVKLRYETKCDLRFHFLKRWCRFCLQGRSYHHLPIGLECQWPQRVVSDFFLLRVAKTIRTLFYLCQTLIKTILFMRWNVNKL